MSTSGPQSFSTVEAQRVFVANPASSASEAVNLAALGQYFTAGDNVSFTGSTLSHLVINAANSGSVAEPNSFYVSTDGDDANAGNSRVNPFATVNAAAAAATAAGGQNIIEALPGTYPDIDNTGGPIAVPADTSFFSEGGHEVTKFRPQDPNQALFTFAGGVRAHGFGIENVTGAAAIISNSTNDKDVHLSEVRFNNCQTGLAHSQTGGGGLGRVEVHWVEFYQCGSGVDLSSNAIALVRDCAFDECHNSVNPTDTTCNIDFQTSLVRGPGAVGVTIRGPMTVRGILVDGFDVNYNVGNGGTTNATILNSTSLNSGVYDIDIQAASGQVRLIGGLLDSAAGFRLNNPNNIPIFGYFYQDFPGDTATRVLGELQVGASYAPAESAFGGGDSHTNNMVVFSSTSGGALTDRTVAARTVSGSTFPAFDDLLAGAALYVGGDVQFTGIKTLVDTAIHLGAGGTLIWEYGVNTNPVTLAAAPNTWTRIGNISNNGYEAPFHLCVRDSDSPYAIRVDPGSGPVARVEDIFGTAESDQVRFGLYRYWEKTTVGGQSKYWFRVRVENPITAAPILQQIKLGTDRFEINADGFVETFGNGREYKSLNWTITQVKRATALGNPANSDVVLTPNLAVGLTDNVFGSGQRDGFGFNTFVPENIDTSLPLFVRIAFRLSAGVAGGEKLRMPLYYRNLTKNGAVFTSTAGAPTDALVAYPNEADADAVGGVFTTYTLPATGATDVVVLTYLLDTAAMRFSAASVTDVDEFWVSLIREGSDATDTLGANVIMFGLEGLYPSCQPGNYLTSINSVYK